MKQKIISEMLLALFLMSISSLASNVHAVKADYPWSETIYIHSDGSIEPVGVPISTVDHVTYTLMDNIGNAAPSSGDIAVIIERDNIILDGAGYTLQGMDAWRSKGIDLSGRSNVTIENMNIRNFYSGIELSHSSDSTVSGNNITDNGSGVYLYWSSNFNTVSGNNITDNEYGVWLYLYYSSNFSTVTGNTITNNDYGVWLSESSNSTVAGNTITNNMYGIYLSESSDNTVSDNSITDNGSGVLLYESSDNTVSDNSITDNGSGVLLYYSSDSVVSGNNITDNEYGSGVWLYESSDSTVAGNTLTDNEYGVWLYANSDSVVSRNNITNNAYGVRLYNSSGNTLYHNNFVDNTQHVYDRAWDDPDVPPSINVWDDGYPSGGNYWSDYEERYPEATEIDDSGIWNTPYVIDEHNQDNHPLMEPWTPTPPIPTTIAELKTEIEELGSKGEIDNQGVVRGLVAKLNVAQRLADRGKIDEVRSILEDDFIPQVQSLSGIHISVKAADLLIESAEHIIAHL